MAGTVFSHFGVAFDRLHLIFINTDAAVLSESSLEGVSMKATRVGVLAFALAAAACNNNSTSLTAPTNQPTSSVTFTGTVQVGGVDFNSFVVSQAGDVQVTLTQAGPPSTITVGLGFGTPSAAACPLTIGSTRVGASTTPLDVGTLSPGTYCVQIFDVGNQAGPITYSVTVTHP